MTTLLDPRRIKAASHVVDWSFDDALSGRTDVADVFPSTGKRENIVFTTMRGENAGQALHARYLRHVIRTLVDRQPPALLLEYVSMILHRRFADFDDHATIAGIFFGALQGGVLSYASAGPLYASFIQTDEPGFVLTTAAKPLGRKAAQRFSQRTIDVSPGDRLVVADGRRGLHDLKGTLHVRFE